MKKITLGLITLSIVFCHADMICLENKTGEELTIQIEQGEYTMEKCIPLQISCKLVAMHKNFQLKNNEQFLFHTQHIFDTNGPNKPCGFFINQIAPMIDIVDDEFEKGQFGDFTVENIINYADNPLPGAAFFSERVYRITKTTSEQTSPQKLKIYPTRKAYSED